VRNWCFLCNLKRRFFGFTSSRWQRTI